MFLKDTQAVRNILERNKGKFFSVTFTKKNGELRTINGQIGKKRGHTGKNTVSHIDKYVTVVENLPDGKYRFRNVNLETISRLAVGGRVYER